MATAFNRVYEVLSTPKREVVVTVQEFSCDATESVETGSSRPSSIQNHDISQRQKSKGKTQHGPNVKQWERTRERLKLASQIVGCTLRDARTAYRPISSSHQYTRRIVQPLATWRGKNHRVLTGHSLGSTTIRDGDGPDKTVIHAASHNYAGFYKPTPESEQLHQLALDTLPWSDPDSCPNLTAVFHEKLANFLSADFCATTSTGYASNLLAFSAILDPTWTVILDEKSHNSMNVGTYLNDVGKVLRFHHNDMNHLEELLSEHCRQHENVLVAVEGLYSMDGTIPPLDQLAYLKDQFGFTLLVDEAHSFLSIGRTGHGCLELWNDTYPHAQVDEDLVDIRTATLSKSLSSIGGVVAGKARFRECVLVRRDELLKQGMDPVLTATMVQSLHILNQPAILQRRLERMRSVIAFVRAEVERFGLFIYGDAFITPLLPVHTGPPSLAAKMSYVLRKKGILATPVSKPATGFWESRVRVCLSADHTDEMVNSLVLGIITAAQDIGVAKKCPIQAKIFSSSPLKPTKTELVEAQMSLKSISDLIRCDTSIKQCTSDDQSMIDAGHSARQNFGIAAGGSRWISGTFTVHMELEAMLVQYTGLPEAIAYSENYLGLTSSIAALCRPLSPYKKHIFLTPEATPQTVLDGIKIAPKKTTPTVQQYTGVEDLFRQIERAVKSHGQITVYIDTNMASASVLRQYTETVVPGLTILLHDASQKLKSRRGQGELRETVDTLRQISRNILVFGSFFESFGVPGAYLVGTQELIEEFRYTSRGYMFSTAPLPFTVAMILQGLVDAKNRNQ